LEGLTRETQSYALPSELLSLQVRFKRPKRKGDIGRLFYRHGEHSLRERITDSRWPAWRSISPINKSIVISRLGCVMRVTSINPRWD